MRRPVLAACAAAGFAGAPACSIPEKTLDPYACTGMQPKPSGTQVTIRGTVVEAISGDPVPIIVPIEAHLRDVTPDLPLAMTQTNGQSAFEQHLQTGGNAVGIYLRATPAGFLETRFYPPRPIAREYEAGIVVVTMEGLAAISSALGVQLDPSKALIVITATDCTASPLGGARITLNRPAGAILYIGDDGLPSQTAVETDKATGTAFAINVGVGSTTITATSGSHTLSSDTFTTVAGVLSQTELQP